ncbi:MAG: hypothetical protein AAGE59_29470, partial [Cyanobacteria bacterium P01_F01_bin.86]
GNRTSGPSYIPAESFSQALLESLQIEDLRKVLLESRLLQLIEEKLLLPLNHMVNDLRASTANEFLLSAEFKDLEQSIGQLVKDFQEKRTTLAEALDRLLTRLEEFAAKAQEVLPDNHHLTETFMRRLHYLKNGLASTTLDKSALLKTIQPTLSELISVLDHKSRVYRELKTLVKRESPTAKAILESIESQSLPDSLRDSLSSLAEKAASSLSAKASDTLMETAKNVSEEPITNLKIYLADLESDVKAFGTEIEGWFNRGMDRASGVYRRNSKAVALLVGIGIAVGLNADSLHMLDSLSRDPVVRNAIGQAATQLDTTSAAIATVDQLQEQVDSLLEADSLIGESRIPLGYGDLVTMQQEVAQNKWFIPVVPRRVVGWLITGFAISMGSNFWFSLLKRVISVKSSGREAGPR